MTSIRVDLILQHPLLVGQLPKRGLEAYRVPVGQIPQDYLLVIDLRSLLGKLSLSELVEGELGTVLQSLLEEHLGASDFSKSVISHDVKYHLRRIEDLRPGLQQSRFK